MSVYQRGLLGERTELEELGRGGEGRLDKGGVGGELNRGREGRVIDVKTSSEGEEVGRMDEPLT